MKAVLNIVAAVLVAAGLVVTVASLLTPGQVILGIDFKLAAILVVGGLILHALASALLLLQRMSHDLRLLRKAGSEEPPWLRQAAQSGIRGRGGRRPCGLCRGGGDGRGARGLQRRAARGSRPGHRRAAAGVPRDGMAGGLRSSVARRPRAPGPG
jgi:hypothetical protein